MLVWCRSWQQTNAERELKDTAAVQNTQYMLLARRHTRTHTHTYTHTHTHTHTPCRIYKIVLSANVHSVSVFKDIYIFIIQYCVRTNANICIVRGKDEKAKNVECFNYSTITTNIISISESVIVYGIHFVALSCAQCCSASKCTCYICTPSFGHSFFPTLLGFHSTRRQRKKEYLGNIFFGTATDVDGGGGGLMQLEQVGATEE